MEETCAFPRDTLSQTQRKALSALWLASINVIWQRSPSKPLPLPDCSDFIPILLCAKMNTSPPALIMCSAHFTRSVASRANPAHLRVSVSLRESRQEKSFPSFRDPSAADISVSIFLATMSSDLPPTMDWFMPRHLHKTSWVFINKRWH